MTTDPDKQPEAPQKPSESPEKGPFNPFLNEEDMFKVVLWVAGGLLVLIVVVLALRALL